MPSLSRPLLVGSLLPLLFACASKPAPLPPKTAAAPAAPMQVAAPGPDLSPVSTPAELVVLGRFARPSAMASTVANWVSLPFDVKMLDALEPGISEALSLDAPVEFAVVLPTGGLTDAKPEVVVSIGLSSVAKGKALLESYNGSSLQEKSPEVWVSADDAKASCAIAPAVGKAANRLVCGASIKDVIELLPYATRGLPLEQLGTADMRTEVRFGPLQRKFGSVVRMGKSLGVPAVLKVLALDEPKFDSPLADAAHALGDEAIDWFDDVDRFTFELNADKQPEALQAKVTVSYKSKRSTLVSATAGIKNRMTAATPLFFDLPADATRAKYTSSTDPKYAERVRLLTDALVDGYLGHIRVSEELRREFIKSIDALLQRGDSMAMAEVPMPPMQSADENNPVEHLKQLIGCHVMGIDGPAAPYQAMLQSFTKLSNDKTFRKGFDQIVAEKLEQLDQVGTEHSAKKPKVKVIPKKKYSELVTFKAKSMAGLPKGTSVVAIQLDAKATDEILAEAQKKMRRSGNKLPKLGTARPALLIALVPDGARTWVIVTADEKALLARANAAVSGSNSPRLSSRADLAPLRSGVSFYAGFASLVSLKGYLSFALQANNKPVKTADTVFSTLPHHGTTPMFFRYVVNGSDQQPTVEATVAIPREVFDDVTAAIPSLMMSF